jgi:hypothetical protein
MKKIIRTLSLLALSCIPTRAQDLWPLYSDQEFLEALFWMYDEDYTRYSTPDNYRPFDVLTRQEWAHFLATYASKEKGTILDLQKDCVFNDLDQADPTLQNSILFSCLLGIFQWYEGSFRPQDAMTKAEFLAVLVRSIGTTTADETKRPRRQDYYTTALQRWLTTESDPSNIDKTLSRYEVALLLNRASLFLESQTYLDTITARLEIVNESLTTTGTLNE